MFGRTRLKLTAWYLLIIMLISISFSVAMYRVLTGEFDRVERIQKFRQEHILPSPTLRFDPDIRQDRIYILDPQLVEETKERILIILILTNMGIFIISAGAGYFLAGRTLRPIQDMVDEQNRFITDASHELRTPITSLRSEIEVALREKGISKGTKELLESNLEDVNSLQTLANKLILLAQYDRNSISNWEAVSLKEVIEESVKKVSGLAKHKHIILKSKIKSVFVFGDKASLTELFVIFLDNAIKYSSNNTTISISTEIFRNNAKVTIIDQGIGIAEKEVGRIFERFYKIDKSRNKTTSDGFGLGLSIAKQIVKEHNGSIQVKSIEGKGTTFAITLPIKE